MRVQGAFHSGCEIRAQIGLGDVFFAGEGLRLRRAILVKQRPSEEYTHAAGVIVIVVDAIGLRVARSP